jgi:hypothetical protein
MKQFLRVSDQNLYELAMSLYRAGNLPPAWRNLIREPKGNEIRDAEAFAKAEAKRVRKRGRR